MHDDFMESLWKGNMPCPATVQRVSDRESPSLDFSAPRLIIRVRPSSLLNVGDIVTRQGVRFLLAKHSTTADYRSFWGFEADREVPWQTVQTTNHPLTNLPQANGLSAPTNLWVAWEIMTRQPYERDLGVSNELSRVLTAANVQLNDIIAGQQVKRVNHALGLTIAEVQ